MAVCKIADLDSEIADFVQMLTAIVKLNRWSLARRRREKIEIWGPRLRISNGETAICDQYE